MDQSRNFGRAGSMYDPGRAVSTVRTPVGHRFPQGGGLKGFLERSLSPEVMLTRSSLDVPPAEKAVHSWAPTQEPLAVSTSLGGGSGDLNKLLHQEGTMVGTD